MDPQQFNQDMDAHLSASGVVDGETFARFADAHGYDIASSVGWLEAKLRVLQSRLLKGNGLELYVPALGHPVSVVSQDAFFAWVGEHFPNASLQGGGERPNNSFKPKPLRGSA